MASKDEGREDVRRWITLAPSASASSISNWSTGSGSYTRYGDGYTLGSVVIEPAKPEAKLTKMISEMEKLVNDNPELMGQFREFLNKHTESFDIDFDI